MKQITLRLILFLSVMAALLVMAHTSSVTRASDNWMAKVDAALLVETRDNAPAEFLVVLTERADLSSAGRFSDKTERGRYVYNTLTELAARTQAPIRVVLDQSGATYRPYWVNNMVWVRGDWDILQAMASRGDVYHIYANTWRRMDLPQPVADNSAPRQTGIEWNIDIVGAPKVWSKGFTGQGAVIGGQDTGYDWQHPALINQYRGWDGTTADHDYNWHDAIHDDLSGNGSNLCGLDATQPCDDHGHGTHTMGTMVGKEPGLGIGMAPGARWIGCRNMEDGVGSPVTYAECYEWFIAPYPTGGDSFTDGDPAKAPHVINNSWSCGPDEGCTTSGVLQSVVAAVRAAGIMTVHSAGNSGSRCASVDTPAAIYSDSFTVGATENDNSRASFSSRGPVTADGSGRTKPDIMAPGVGIHSSVPKSIIPSGYSYLSGTSMAAPHVAGLVALLISADPDLAGRVNDLETIIEQTALRLTVKGPSFCGANDATSIPNNDYGWGRIDSLAAWEMAASGIIPRQSFMPALVP